VIYFFDAVTLATLIDPQPMIWDSLLTSTPKQCSFLTSEKMYFLLNFPFPTHLLVRVLLVSDAHNFSAFMPSGELLLEI
jgi:hypothetical protein